MLNRFLSSLKLRELSSLSPQHLPPPKGFSPLQGECLAQHELQCHPTKCKLSFGPTKTAIIVVERYNLFVALITMVDQAFALRSSTPMTHLAPTATSSKVWVYLTINYSNSSKTMLIKAPNLENPPGWGVCFLSSSKLDLWLEHFHSR